MQQNNEAQHQHQGDGGVDGADQETHDHAADQTQQTRVPAEVAECRPVKHMPFKQKLINKTKIS